MTMSIKQIYYTSARKGISGGGNPGLQVVAASEGCTTQFFNEIEKHTAYKYENDFPLEPTQEDFSRTPPAFGYSRTKGGEKILYQTVYRGTVDYSNRKVPFSHFFVDSDDIPGFNGCHPMLFWKSPDFWEGPITSTNEISSTAILPPIESLRPGLLDQEADIQAFLKNNEKLEYFLKMLSAAELFFSKPRRIIIADSAENTARWIYALSMVLPLRLTTRLTFITYSYDPQWGGDHLITGTTRRTAFDFSPLNINQIFYVFDFIEHVTSPLDELTPYAKSAGVLLREGRLGIIEEFCSFCDMLASEVSFKDIFGLFVIFGYHKGIEFTPQELSSGFKELYKRLSEELDLLSPLISALLDREELPPSHILKAAEELYIESRTREIPERSRSHITTKYFTLFLKVILNSDDSNLIERNVELFTKYPVPESYWGIGKGKILEQVLAADTPEWAFSLINLARLAHLLPLPQEILEKVALRVLFPSLISHPKSLISIGVLRESGVFEQIVVLFLEYLDTLENAEKIDELVSVFTGNKGEIISKLVSRAKERAQGELYIRLLRRTPGFASDRAKRYYEVSGDIAAMRRDKKIDFALPLRLLVSLLWPGQDDLRESDLCDLYHKYNLSLEALFDDTYDLGLRVKNCILNYELLLAPGVDMNKFFTDILTHRELSKINKGSFAYILEFLESLVRFKEKSSKKELGKEQIGDYCAVLERLSRKNHKVIKAVLTQASQMLIRKTSEYEMHREAFKQLMSRQGPLFAGCYENVLRSLSNEKIVSAATMVTIFKVIKGQTSIEGGTGEKSLEGAFSELYKNSSTLHDEIKVLFEKDRKWGPIFSEWEKKQGGIFSSIKHLFSGKKKNAGI